MFNAMNEQLDKVDVGTKSIKQNFSSTCVTTLHVEEGSSSETDIFLYKFNFSDINPSSVNYKISKSKMQVEFETNAKEKLIKKVQNGEQQAYINKLLLDCKGTEQARMLIHTLKALVDQCKSEQSEINLKGTEAKVDWLKENIKEVSLGKKVLQQSFSGTDERTKFEFKQVSVSGSSSSEVLYVFNATDIDQASINFKISGKNLSIEVKSNQRAKIFKSYKDGGVVNYENEFEIYFDEIETAKSAIQVLKGLKQDLE